MWNRRRELQATAEHWEAFRRYLHDFPRLADKPADTLPLWESYLVYGIAFGLADRVMEAARMQFPAVISSPPSHRGTPAATRPAWAPISAARSARP